MSRFEIPPQNLTKLDSLGGKIESVDEKSGTIVRVLKNM